MGEILQLPTKKKAERQTFRSRGFATGVADPTLRAALLTLYENDEHLARVTKLNIMEACKRLDTLEAIVFAQSVIIAELRGQPLTPQQRAKISGVLKRKGKKVFNLE